ncbi:MAG: histidine kinase, partial [Bacteroidetes bacterium]|nr:histidine kinase [Bacteroidota bacterium]
RGMYLIFKEGLNNCLKHSKASLIEICIGCEGNRLILQVKDNGVGFTAGDSPESLGGNGMFNIRKRAEEIGASIAITSAPNEGVNIRIEKELTQLSH